MKRILTTGVLIAVLAGFTSATPTAEEQRCFDAVNILRQRYDLPPLMMNEELVNDSRSWSVRMKETHRLYHSGIPLENCAVGSEDGVATAKQWERSPPHRALLLSRAVTEVGIGNAGTWWTLRAKNTDPAKTPAIIAPPKVLTTNSKTTVTKYKHRRLFYRLFH